MKLELNLTTAFTLRKRIKELLGKVNYQLQSSNYVVESERVNEVLETIESGNIESAYKLYAELLNANRELTDLIDQNNADGKKLLNEVTMTNQKINLITVIDNKLKANRTSKSRNPVTGNWEVTTLTKITEFDTAKELETLKQKKVRLEDELTKVNSKAKLTFDLNDEIYKRIYGE